MATVQVAPIQTYQGPQVDILGNFARGQEIAQRTLDMGRQDDARQKLQGILSDPNVDYEKAAAQMLPLDPKMAGTLLQMEQGRLNRQVTMEQIAQQRIRQKQQQIAQETKVAMGAVRALEGVEDIGQKSRIYDLYLRSVERQGMEVPEDLKTGYSEENEQNLRDLAEIGQMMLDMDPSQKTAQIRNFEYMQSNPAFKEFYEREGQRDLSGTESIVQQLRAEDPSLTYAQALSIAQGLARKAQTIQDGRVVPLEGATEAAGEFKYAEAEGAEVGKGEGEAEVRYRNFMAALPGLEKTASDLYPLADAATYNFAGKTRDTIVRELGFDVGSAAEAKAKFEAIAKNDLFPQLRDMFGGNMATREIEMLLTTYGDTNLSPSEKKAQIDARVDGWKKEAEKLARRTGNEAPENMFGDVGATRLRFNPETGDFE